MVTIVQRIFTKRTRKSKISKIFRFLHKCQCFARSPIRRRALFEKCLKDRRFFNRRRATAHYPLHKIPRESDNSRTFKLASMDGKADGAPLAQSSCWVLLPDSRTGADSAARRPHRLPISRPAHDPGRAQLQLGRRSLGRRPVPRCRRQEWRRSRNDGIAFARPAAEAAGRERGWLLTA